jgi:hypothetical protein
MRNGYKILVGKTEEMRPLERPRRKWEDIKIGFYRNRIGGRGLEPPG